MWRVTADNGLPRCEGYRWLRFGLLGSSFGGGLAVSGRGGATCRVRGERFRRPDDVSDGEFARYVEFTWTSVDQ